LIIGGVGLLVFETHRRRRERRQGGA
jgi:hypothetical protein